MSVVITTRDAPVPLVLVLAALARQVPLPEEVLVADDGSGPATREALRAAAPGLPFRLVHVRQPHEGFRVARSRNNAIHQARGDRIAFLDQDTLPHPGWLARHLAGLRPGRLSLGYLLRLSPAASGRLDADAVARGEFARWHTPAEYRRLRAVHAKYSGYALLRRLGCPVKGRPALRSGNAAVCVADLARVNGFDEEYVGWGQEDDDLGWRLYLSGVRPVPRVAAARVSHIHHEERHPDWRAGGNIERYRRPRLSPRCARGLDDHPHPDVEVAVLRA